MFPSRLQSFLWIKLVIAWLIWSVSTQLTPPSVIQGPVIVDYTGSNNRAAILLSSGNITSPSLPPPIESIPISALVKRLPVINPVNRWPINSSVFELGYMWEQNPFSFQTDLQNVLALQCLIEQINSNPLFLPNLTMKLVPVNASAYISAQASIASLDFANETTSRIAVIGPSNGNTLFYLSKYFLSKEMSVASSGARSSFFKLRSDYPNLHIVAPTHDQLVDIYFELFKYFKWDLVAAIFAEDEIGQSARFQFEKQAALQGVKFSCIEQIAANDPTSAKIFNNCLRKSTDTKVVVFWGATEAGLQYLLSAANDPEINQKTFLLSENVAQTFAFLPPEQTAKILELLYGTKVIQPTGLLPPGTPNTCSNANYRPSPTDDPFFIAAWQFSFTCILPFTPEAQNLPECPPEEGFFKSGGSVTRLALGPCRCREDEGMEKQFNFSTFFDLDTVRLYALALQQILYNCSAISTEELDYCALDSLTGLQLIPVMDRIQFESPTGIVSFNPNGTTTGRIGSNALVYQTDFAAFPYVQGQGFKFDLNKVTFKNGNGTNPPKSTITPNNTDLSSGTASVLMFSFSIALLVILLALFTFTLIVDQRIHKDVYELSFIVFCTIGIVCLLVSNILWCLTQSQAMCMAKASLAFIGMIFILACLTYKAFHALEIFSNSKDRYSSLIACAMAFLLVTLFMFLYFFASGIPQYGISQSQYDQFYLYVSCSTSPSSYTTVILSVLAGLIVAVLLFNCIVYLISWNLETRDSETTFFLFINFNLIILSCILVPIYFAEPDYRGYDSAQFLIRSLGVLFVGLFTGGLLFIPKIFRYFTNKKAKNF